VACSPPQEQAVFKEVLPVLATTYDNHVTPRHMKLQTFCAWGTNGFLRLRDGQITDSNCYSPTWVSFYQLCTTSKYDARLTTCIRSASFTLNSWWLNCWLMAPLAKTTNMEKVYYEQPNLVVCIRGLPR